MTSFQFSTTVGTERGEQPLYSFNGVRRFTGPSGTVVLYKPRGDQRSLVQPNVADALSLCAHFRTLDEHTKKITDHFPALREHAENTKQILQGFADSGLFESSQMAWRRLTDNAGSLHQSAEGRLFILTCDRPRALHRLLSALTESTIPNAIEGLWIIDDSKDSANESENAAIVETTRPQFPTPIHLVGSTERDALITHIKRALPDSEETIDWLLNAQSWGTTPTYGVARNLALLLSVGKRALVLDDDVIPQAIAPPFAPQSLRFAEANRREAKFFASQSELARHALTIAESPISLMLSSLGESLGALLPRHLSGHREMLGIDGGLLDHRNADSIVRLSQCGSWGDPGTAEANWIFHLQKASIEKLLALDSPLSTVVGARASWLGHRGPVLSSYGTMSQLTGIDHSTLMPPYVPAGRAEDILFGIALQRLHPEAVVWNEGWSIQHSPTEDRESRTTLHPLKVTAGNSLLADWLGREPADQWGLNPTTRLRGVAEEVQRLTEMQNDHLAQLIQEGLISKASRLLSRCVQHLGDAGTFSANANVSEWQVFLEATRDQLVAHITQSYDEAASGSKGAGITGDIARAREHGERFAASLRIWPEICACVEDMPTRWAVGGQ